MGKRLHRWLCVLLVALCASAEAQLRLLTEEGLAWRIDHGAEGAGGR